MGKRPSTKERGPESTQRDQAIKPSANLCQNMTVIDFLASILSVVYNALM
jgi:hypothetical protein